MSNPIQQPLVFIGPSGSGKSTIIRMLAQDNIVRVQPTWTTRPVRPDEEYGTIEHKFVSDDEFEVMHQKGAFLRTVRMFGLPYQYGLPKLSFHKEYVTAVILRASLVDLFTKYYPQRIVYQIFDKEDRVVARLAKREAFGEKAGGRYEEFYEEVQLGKKLSDRSFSNTNIPHTLSLIRQSIMEDFNFC